MVQRKDIKTEDIIRLYQKGLIGREIAERLGCSIPLVQQRLAKAGMKMRPCNARRTIEVDPNVLKEMYWAKKMHPREIGEVLGMHKNTVTKKMREFGIPFRTKSEARIKELNPIYGIGHSEETKQKMSSLFMEGRRVVSMPNQYGNPTKYKDIVFRSTWEAGVAFYLDDLDEPYFYEHRTFPYKNEEGHVRSYTPDFYLPKRDFYIEVKGAFRDRDLHKIEQAAKTAGIKIELWDMPKLVELGVINTAGKVIVGLDKIQKIKIGGR